MTLYVITMLNARILKVFSCVYVMKDLMVMDLTAQVIKLSNEIILNMHAVVNPGFF